jgi:hypothetical protein
MQEARGDAGFLLHGSGLARRGTKPGAIWLLAAIAAGLAFVSGCSASEDATTAPGQADKQQCESLVEAYVTKTRSWDRDQYTIVEERAAQGARGFAVLPVSQDGPRPPGETSGAFHLEVDPGCKSVLAELHYQ